MSAPACYVRGRVRCEGLPCRGRPRPFQPIRRRLPLRWLLEGAGSSAFVVQPGGRPGDQEPHRTCIYEGLISVLSRRLLPLIPATVLRIKRHLVGILVRIGQARAEPDLRTGTLHRVTRWLTRAHIDVEFFIYEQSLHCFRWETPAPDRRRIVAVSP
jgi:hypothetical protein